MAIKVVVGSSPQRTVTQVLQGERKPLITPDSVRLGVDTVGEYVATLTAGNGMILFPEDANTRNIETSNIVVVHASTTTEESTNNDILSFVRNVDIDQFGHVTLFENSVLDSNTFFLTTDGLISTYDITLGNTALTLNEVVDRIEDLTLLNVADITIANNTIASDSDLNLRVGANSVIDVANTRIIGVATPQDDSDATTKSYVDIALDNLESGLLFVADPQGPNDATNKRYVDNLVQGLNVKPSALAATTADLGGTFTEANNTLVLPPYSTMNIDDVTLWEVGDNILVKDQNNPEENGTYDIVALGNNFAPWVLKRSEYANESSELPGSFEFVTDGTVNGNKAFVATVVDAERYVINRDAVTWTQFFGEGNYFAGDSLALVNGREFVLSSNVTVESITADDLETLKIVSNTVVIDSSGALVLPVGTTNERSGNIRGMIRYNTSASQFEGYDGVAWQGLGGVVDVDQDTKIIAEDSPGADNDQLKFITGDVNRLTIDQFGILANTDINIETTGALTLPDGTSAQRDALPQFRRGMIRYNTSDDQFEGYNGNNWQGLGGVVDVDQDTRITAEYTPGGDQDELNFYAGGNHVAQFYSNKDVYFYGNMDVSGNVVIGGNIRLGDNEIDNIQVVADFTSNLLPNAQDTYMLGGTGKNWYKLFAGRIGHDSNVVIIETEGALTLPVGATGDRPSPTEGMIRFNTDDNRFEGYDGTLWAGLAGSVIDVDQDTKIIAETSPNADNDQLQFFTDGNLRLTIDSDGTFATPAGNNLTFDVGGIIDVGNTIISNVQDPVNPQDAVTKFYLEEGGFASTLEIKDGANTHNVDLLRDPTLTLGRGLEVQDANSTAFELGLDVTGATPGIYGNDGQVPRIRITPDGRVDFATEVPIEIVANAVPNFTEVSMDITGLMFRDGTHTGVFVEYDDVGNTINISHNTSPIVNTENSDAEFIQNLSFDDFGHVVVLETANTDARYMRLDGEVHGSNTIVAPRFADSSNTEYFIDPFETSQIRNLILGYGSNTSSIEMSDGPLATDRSYIYAFNGDIGFIDNSFNYFARANRNTGDFEVTGNLIAGGFADSQDTSFVINPADISNVNKFYVEDHAWFGYNISLDDQGFQANNGVIEFGGAKLRNVGIPVNSQDAVTLGFMQAAIQGGEGTSLSNSFTIDVNVDGSTLEIVNDITRVKDGGITNVKIATPHIKISGETNAQIPESFINETLTLYDGSDWSVSGTWRDETFSFTTEPTIQTYIGDTLNFSISGANTISLYIKTSETSGTGDAALGVTNQGATGGETLTFVPDTVGTYYYIDINDTNRSGQIIVSEQYTPDELVNLGETLTFAAGEGINTVVSNNTVTISAELATAFASNDNRGIAAFANADFVVTNGVVELATSGVTANTYGSSTAIPILTIDEHGLITVASTASVAGVDGVSYEGSNNTITIVTGDGSEFHIQTETSVELAGKVTGTASSSNGTVQITTELEDTGVVANTYGSSTAIPIITVDVDGRITVANTTAVAGVEDFTYEKANNTLTLSTGDGSDFNAQLSEFDAGIDIGTTRFRQGKVVDFVNSIDISSATLQSVKLKSGTVNQVVGWSTPSGQWVQLYKDGIERFATSNTGVIANGNIEVSGTVDGRDIAADGATLDSLAAATTTVQLSGDVTGSATSNSNNIISVTTDISDSGVTAGTYGNASQIPIVAVAADGRITSMSNTAVAGVDAVNWYSANSTLAIETGDGSIFEQEIDEFDNITVKNSNGGSLYPAVKLFRDIANPTNKEVGQLQFQGYSSFSQPATYGGVKVRALDHTSGDLKARMNLEVASGSLGNIAGIQIHGEDREVLLRFNTRLDAGANLVFEGTTANGFETTFTATGPTADRTITIPDASGTLLTTGNATDLLNTLLTVDGDGSGIDADSVDGYSAAEILDSAANTAGNLIGDGEVFLYANTGVTIGSPNVNNRFNLNSANSFSFDIGHADTSSVSDVTLADGNVLNGMTFDTFGHVQTTSSLDLDGRYYTETELDAGQLDNRYYTETELDAGQLDNRYYTETEADSLFFNVSGDTVTGNSTFEENVDIDGNLVVDGTINRNPRITLNGFVNGFTDLTNLANGSMFTSTDTVISVGDGLDIVGGTLNANVQISHSDTSSVTNVSGVAEKEVINEVTFDTFGHVVSANTKTLDYISQAEADVRYVNETGDTMTGNLEVQAVISQEFSAFHSESLTLTTTSPTTLFSFAKADFMGGEFIITGKTGINKHITKMLVVHDGTTASATEFGKVVTNSDLASYDVNISGSDVQILVTPSSATSTEFVTFATLIKD